MIMDLKQTHNEVANRLRTIDFSELYPTFRPYRFALYNDTSVCLNGEIIDKTQAFLANTAIQFNNEWIAIWQLGDNMDLDILASKLAHEMFHAHQMNLKDSRFPNDLDVLYQYDLNVDNLSRKLEENRLIVRLLEDFSTTRLERLLSLRKQRASLHPYEFDYEARIEEVEGTANYIELEVLKRLSPAKYESALAAMTKRIVDATKQIPIRILSYDIGALLLTIVMRHVNGMNLAFDSYPFPIKLLASSQPSTETILPDPEMETVIHRYHQQTKDIINSALSQHDLIAEGTFDLLGINIYNARFQDPYLVSTFFVLYLDEGEQVLQQGNFVIELDNNHKAKRIFKYS